jgi:hypothetical protein
MTIQETVYKIETLKLLMSLDNDYEQHSWYMAEIESLALGLKKLLKKKI